MRIVGVIAEYNPFHRGHAHQLSQARTLSQADYVVAVMSGCFVQRGDAALLSPAVRAEMALKNGADAVLLLPSLWSVRDAEHFALGGVSLLHDIGCHAISFGAETADGAALLAAAQALEAPADALQSITRQQLSGGLPYPAAISAAMEAFSPHLSLLLSSPNNTLGICYLRAMLRFGSQMAVFPVPRVGDYHATSLSDGFSSATAVRRAILQGDWCAAYDAMPQTAATLLQQEARTGALHRPEALDTALMARLRLMSDADYAALPDLSEGIENRLHRAAETALSREALLQSAKTRRYPYARLSRLATHALLGYTQALLDDTVTPPAAFLLGFRKGCEPLISQLSQGRIPLISSISQTDRTAPWLALEERAWALWALGAGMKSGLLARHKMIRI